MKSSSEFLGSIKVSESICYFFPRIRKDTQDVYNKQNTKTLDMRWWGCLPRRRPHGAGCRLLLYQPSDSTLAALGGSVTTSLGCSSFSWAPLLWVECPPKTWLLLCRRGVCRRHAHDGECETLCTSACCQPSTLWRCRTEVHDSHPENTFHTHSVGASRIRF